MSICPRCQRPLEDEEPYICCAGQQLRWRCADCHKVSEGFAFPYGMCPHCKGKLELFERGALQDDAALVAVRKAFEIELGGHAFYERASRESKDEELRELFGRFAAMEKEHMETLSKRYHAELPAPSADFQLDRAAIFAGVDRKPEDPANLFRIAIAFEQRAVDFFSQEGERAPAGSVESQLYKELAAEEREHVALLTTEYKRWEAGKAGIL
jgi:rubrerythrin/DNA-directed RNA polymerase subunit RPC12/RpoP